MSSRIAKIKKDNIAKTESRVSSPIMDELSNSEGIKFSFKLLDFNEYFNLDATCVNWSYELMQTLKNISQLSTNDITSGTYGTLRFHKVENATQPTSLPSKVELKDMHQLAIGGTSKGRIHGILTGDTFYIIWLDPLHNLYPSRRHGGLRTITPPKNCCMDRDEELEKLNKENEELRKEIEIWEDLEKEST